MAKRAAKSRAPKTAKKTRKPRRKVNIEKLVPTTSPEFQEQYKAYQVLAGNKELANKQWYTWYLKQGGGKVSPAASEDATAKLIEDTLTPVLRGKKKVPIPQGGYVMTAGRKNNIVVKRAQPKKR